MQAGNAFYTTAQDIPAELPVLSMASIMLMPGGFVPLTLADPRFIQMAEDAMRGSRLIGLVLVKDGSHSAAKTAEHEARHFSADLLQKFHAANDNAATWNIGCCGRITNYSETGDGQLLISLQGVCRFRLERELHRGLPYRQYAITPFLRDLAAEDNSPIDRATFMRVFQDYMEANHIQADWEIIAEVSNSALVNALSVIVPFAPAEKQALLEAPDLKTRSETMIAIAQRSMLADGKYGQRMVQ